MYAERFPLHGGIEITSQSDTTDDICENGRASLTMDRKSKFLSMFDSSGFGLEIGPSYGPVLPKKDGFNVQILDHVNTSDLRNKYSSLSEVDVSQIEEVDFVSDGRPMAEVIGRSGIYDYIVASHVIEHTTDMLGFLRDCETLLKPDGVIVLAVPDMRFCFDRYKPITGIGEIIQAHVDHRSRHTLASLYDHISYFCEIDGASGWHHDNRKDATLKFEPPNVATFIEKHSGGRYVDSHAWRFTPSSFRMIVEDLRNLGEIQFREASFSGSDIFEFFCLLSARGNGPGMTRQELVVASLNEMAVVSTDARCAREKHDDAMRRISDLEHRLATSKEDLRVALLRQSKLETSTSWRMTGPLRRIVSALRR